jgi:hypothetical protein
MFFASTVSKSCDHVGSYTTFEPECHSHALRLKPITKHFHSANQECVYVKWLAKYDGETCAAGRFVFLVFRGE